MITGGLGHIGSRLIRDIPLEHELVVVDNMDTQRYCSLFKLNRKIKFLEKSVDDISHIDMLKVDVIIHLAAYANATKSFGDLNALEKNMSDTKKLLRICSDSEINTFIFPSTTSIYGSTSQLMIEDDISLIKPQSPYAEFKWKTEKMIHRELHGITDFIILRFGTIFGISPGMRFHTAINKFCYDAALGNPLTVWKQNYEQFRPYLGLNDAVRAINLALSGTLNMNETYNVITHNFCLSDIIKMIHEIVDTKIEFIDTPLVNQSTYFVSDKKIRLCGFLPSDNIEKSIKETIDMLSN
jgi:nucleoside-diphosphate-sugar epimerase